MDEDRPTPFEFFNAAVDAFRRGDLSGAVLFLRGGFFENLYISPLLIGEEFQVQEIWYPGVEAEPRAAEEYVRRYGRLWREEPDAVLLVKAVWSDSLVRSELRNFINLSRNLLTARSDHQFAELLGERGLFLNPERLRRTQAEILARLEGLRLRLPPPRPRLGLILLASRNPQASCDFYRKLLGMDPRSTSRLAGGYAEFDLDGVHLAIHGLDQTAADDPYRLGPPPGSLGWGAILVLSVSCFDRYFGNAKAALLEILDSDLETPGRRSFVVKDPSGYLLEITEEEPKGLEAP